MGWFNSKSGDDEKHTIKANQSGFDDLRMKSENHINFKQDPNYLMVDRFKGNNYTTNL